MLGVLLSVLLLLAATPEPVAAQVGLFKLGRWGGSLLFRMQKENREAPELTNQRLYNGALEVKNSGFVINPRLLAFQWTGEFALYLDRYRTELLSKDTRGRLLGHSLITSIFRHSAYPTQIMWNKTSNRIMLDDSGRTNYDVNYLQGTINMPGLAMPSRIQVGWRDFQETWRRAGFDNTRDQLRRSLSYTGNRDAELSTIAVRYNFLNVVDRIRTDWDYVNHTANARYRRLFGDEQQISYDSRANLFVRKGLGDYQSGRVGQSLHLKHMPSLSSRYHHTLSLTHALGGAYLQNTASASLQHRLWESLSSGISLGGSLGKLRGGQTRTYSMSGSVNYSKRIPLSGRFQIGWTRGYSINDIQATQTELSVVHQRYVFMAGLPILLREQDVIMGSILVFDESGMKIFDEGEDRDYFIRRAGDYVEIHRTQFGRIREGDLVLIDYRFRTMPSIRYATNTRVLSTGLSFGGLSITYNVNDHKQDLLRGKEEYLDNLNQLHTKSLQARLNARGDVAGMSALARYRIYETESLSFRSWDFSASTFWRPFGRLHLSNRLTVSRLFYGEDNTTLTSRSLQGELSWRPTRAFILRGHARYRARNDALRLPEDLFEFGGSLERYWRVLRFVLRYEKREWQLGEQFVNEDRLAMEIERTF